MEERLGERTGEGKTEKAKAAGSKARKKMKSRKKGIGNEWKRTKASRPYFCILQNVIWDLFIRKFSHTNKFLILGRCPFEMNENVLYQHKNTIQRTYSYTLTFWIKFKALGFLLNWTKIQKRHEKGRKSTHTRRLQFAFCIVCMWKEKKNIVHELNGVPFIKRTITDSESRNVEEAGMGAKSRDEMNEKESERGRNGRRE